jgi:hypothetical protein
MRRLRSNCRCGVSAAAEYGRLYTPAHKRAHRQRPQFACGVKCLLDRFTFLVADCDGELFFEPCGDASPSRVMGSTLRG